MASAIVPTLAIPASAAWAPLLRPPSQKGRPLEDQARPPAAVPPGPILTDPDTDTTWENIQNAIPLIEHADAIKTVSNTLHAEKGRAYLWKLRPELAQRLAPTREYRFGEINFITPVAAIIGPKKLRGLRA